MKQLKERFDALSDAIVAIVMTILVLEIAVPATTKELPYLLEEIALFLVSFVIIINFWYRHFQAIGVLMFVFGILGVRKRKGD